MESGYSTDPSKSDTDNDGVNDKDEIDSGTNPIIPDDFFVNDKDRDGWKDETEIRFGSNPENPSSTPEFQMQVEFNETNEIELLFPGAKDETYEIQLSDDLKNWLSLEALIIGNGETIRKSFPVINNSQSYRIKRN